METNLITLTLALISDNWTVPDLMLLFPRLDIEGRV